MPTLQKTLCCNNNAVLFFWLASCWRSVVFWSCIFSWACLSSHCCETVYPAEHHGRHAWLLLLLLLLQLQLHASHTRQLIHSTHCHRCRPVCWRVPFSSVHAYSHAASAADESSHRRICLLYLCVRRSKKDKSIKAKAVWGLLRECVADWGWLMATLRHGSDVMAVALETNVKDAGHALLLGVCTPACNAVCLCACLLVFSCSSSAGS